MRRQRMVDWDNMHDAVFKTQNDDQNDDEKFQIIFKVSGGDDEVNDRFAKKIQEILRTCYPYEVKKYVHFPFSSPLKIKDGRVSILFFFVSTA